MAPHHIFNFLEQAIRFDELQKRFRVLAVFGDVSYF